MAVAGILRDEDRCCGNTAGIQTGAVGILLGFNLFLRQPHRNAVPMEIGTVGILLGFHLFLWQPHRNAAAMEIGAVGILLGFHVSAATPQKCRGNGNRSCGNPAGISFVSAATPQTHFRNLANDNDSSASVRIRGKQFCSMCVIWLLNM